MLMRGLEGEAAEELGGGEGEEGVSPRGEDFGHGSEDEVAQMHAGMGEGEAVG